MTERDSYTVSGNDLVDVVQELIHQRNIRRLHLICDGQHLIDIPVNPGESESETEGQELTLLAATEAIGDAVHECTIEIETVGEDDPDKTMEEDLQQSY